MTGLSRLASDPAFAATTWVLLDFEGLTPRGVPAEPIEVGAFLLGLRDGRLECVGRYEALIRPPAHVPLTTAATALTGITARMLADRPTAAVVLAELDAALTGPPHVLVAHHAPTEAAILRRYAHACPRLAAARMLDTVHLARACLPGLPSYTLDALLEHLDIPIPAGRHRALADATVTAELFRRLLADGATDHGWSRLTQLYDLAGHSAPDRGAAQTTLSSCRSDLDRRLRCERPPTRSAKEPGRPPEPRTR